MASELPIGVVGPLFDGAAGPSTVSWGCWECEGPHLPPPGKQVERRKDIQISPSCRAENAGGG
jgi:hypothetical protein